jgi:hypothetical protein
METPMPDGTIKRDRSPSYPSISLKAAVERLVAFEKYFGRHPASADQAGKAWNLKTADQTIAALRYFGLLDYEGRSGARQITISEDGRNYLRAQQDSVKQEILKRAALRPKEIRKFWDIWGDDRPPNDICLDDLTFRNAYSDRGARVFLKVYDATIAFAGLVDSDKIPSGAQDDDGDVGEGEDDFTLDPPPPAPPAGVKRGVPIMEGERVVFAEESDPQRYIKLVASGDIDETLLDALSDYLKRQRKRLGLPQTEADLPDRGWTDEQIHEKLGRLEGKRD